jgi:hypothetical protein
MVAFMYITRPSSTNPDIHTCAIDGNTIIYDVDRITEEGITEMRLKLIQSSIDGAEKVIISPRFAVEVVDGGVDDGGAMQTNTFTALENALAKAEAVYKSRITNMEMTDNGVFKVFYADGTIYESDALAYSLENANKSEYYSNVARSCVEEAKSIVENVDEIVDEAIKHTNYTEYEVDFKTGELLYDSQIVDFNVNTQNGNLEYNLSKTEYVKHVAVEYGVTTFNEIKAIVDAGNYPLVKFNATDNILLYDVIAHYSANNTNVELVFQAFVYNYRYTVICSYDNTWSYTRAEV